MKIRQRVPFRYESLGFGNPCRGRTIFGFDERVVGREFLELTALALKAHTEDKAAARVFSLEW